MSGYIVLYSFIIRTYRGSKKSGHSPLFCREVYVGSFQNYGPLLAVDIIRHLILTGTKIGP